MKSLRGLGTLLPFAIVLLVAAVRGGKCSGRKRTTRTSPCTLSMLKALRWGSETARDIPRVPARKGTVSFPCLT
jgi:hypothetical protein